MYKTRNIGMGNGMQGTQEMGESYIPGNVTKHSRECPSTFQGMSPDIPGNVGKHSGNVAKHSKECPETFQGMLAMLPNIPGNVTNHSGECPQKNVTKHSGECRKFFV